MKRDIHVCTDCRTKVLARPLATLPPKSTSRDWSTSKPTNSMSSTSNQGTGNQKGSNYFFGIIFSVAILILMCATCGIGSRTRYFARRRNLHRATKAHEWKEELMPPRLHEVGFVNAKGTLWKDVMPLSASHLYIKLGKPTKDIAEEFTEDLWVSNTTPLPTPPPPPPGTTVWLRKSPKRMTPSPSELEQPIAIRTLILIAMPRDRRLGVDTDDQRINHSAATPLEFQIGVETLSWNKR